MTVGHQERDPENRGLKDTEAGHFWVSHPHEWQPFFREWNAKHPDRTVLHTWRQLGGQEVVGLTIGSSRAIENPNDVPMRLLVTVPHGHEPAPTAASVDLARQLVERVRLDGSPALLPIDRLQERLLVTLLPDTNPQGRSRSPERCWNGRYDNETFLKVAFGIAADGTRFGRYPEWTWSKHSPRQVGLVYEQIGEDLWVEPNTSRRSTHARAVDALFEVYRYTHMLDMHQHEGDEAALLPADFESLSPAEREELEKWSHALIDGWRQCGAGPRERPSIPYKNQPRQQFFIDFWSDRCPGMLRLVSEVRNNRHVKTGEPTPMAHQFTMAAEALRRSVKMALD